MNVILIFPDQINTEELKDWWYVPKYVTKKRKPQPPFGVLCLYTAISTNHNVTLLDNCVKKLSNEELVEWCLNQNPDVVGFSGTMHEWSQAAVVAKELKTRSNVITIYGGPNATARPEKHIRYFDYVFRGMADDTLLEFLNRLELGNPVDDIPGLCNRDYPEIKPVHFIRNLDMLKWPDRTTLNKDDYRYADSIVVTSKGCPFSCKFCSSRYIWEKKYLTRSIDDVMREIRHLKNTYNIDTVIFREDNFTINKERLFAFCQHLADLNLSWRCQSRVNSLNRETIVRMKESGCAAISCGFESINDSTLQYVKKGQTAKQVRATIDLLDGLEMPWTGGFMVATPNEGRQEIENTIRFVKKVSRYPHSKLPKSVVRFVGMPVSDLYYEVVRNGLVDYDWQEGELLFPHTYHLTNNQIVNIIKNT